MRKATYFDIAEDDYEHAKESVKLTTRVYNAVAISCQQSVEKYYKHIIVEYIDNYDNTFLTKHNLSILRKYIENTYPEVSSVRVQTANLNNFYFKSRYPVDGYVEVSKDLAKRCVGYATEIRKIVQAIAKSEDKKRIIAKKKVAYKTTVR